MELLFNVAKVLVAIAGSLLALIVIVSILKTPFMKKKQKKAEKELMNIMMEAINELKEEAKKEEATKKTTKKPRKSKEN